MNSIFPNGFTVRCHAKDLSPSVSGFRGATRVSSKTAGLNKKQSDSGQLAGYVKPPVLLRLLSVIGGPKTRGKIK